MAAMSKTAQRHALTAILPCNDVRQSQAFYERLGFTVQRDWGPGAYIILSDGRGAHLHLQPAVEGWLTPGHNPFGLYLYAENIDELAARFPGELLPKGVGQPEHKEWGMYEFALSDPDETLVRIGWYSDQVHNNPADR